jgi:catechol 2,3-dioxygenase
MIRSTTNKPPFDVVRCSHAVLGATDLGASEQFYAQHLGYVVTERTPDALYLRNLECRTHHSLVLQRLPEPTCEALVWKVANEDDLDLASRWFQSKNLPAAFVERHGQGRTLRTCDALGMPLEFYFSMTSAPCKLQQYDDYRGARIQRLDHFNCFSPDVQKSYEFWSELGFRLTEYTVSEESNNALWAVWLQRKGGVHDIAFTNGRGPRLHHFAGWVPSVSDLVHSCDLLSTAGYVKNIERGLGRHGIGNALFLYLLDPDGHRIELFCSDYLTVDPDLVPKRWEFRDARRQTLWGMPAPRSWFEHGTPFPNVGVVDPLIKPQPVLAH